jgi:hypothetical protein
MLSAFTANETLTKIYAEARPTNIHLSLFFDPVSASPVTLKALM